MELYKDDNLISFLLDISYNHAGAAHPYSAYYTFNYDIEKHRQIDFADYFDLKNGKDKEALIQLINSEFEDESIRVDKFYDFDFNVSGSTLTFNFDNYEVASYAFGLQRVTLRNSQIENFITPMYRQ